ncbi:transposase IS3 [Ruminiclostridium papyrosolvens C7]|uniref:Transposase IS3 n=1 Tax=Ruminiclostridium papyrosolvens C7 TaxID=1330534 RepID=U4R2K4_9FIRM|nr:transposase IS3 [Ruminiclostridium papyrosolvens C7]
MAKYSFEFKKQVVQAYLAGEGGYEYLAKKYDIPSFNNIKKWIHNYEVMGDKGLMRSRKNGIYPFEKKLAIVELYLTSEISYQDLALHEGIHNPTQLCKWVNDFLIAGPDALRAKKRGRKKSLDIKNQKAETQPTEVVPVDTSAEHVKQLEDQLLKLKIENAYLKELRRLRLEEEALLKKQRELSTASEENSN